MRHLFSSEKEFFLKAEEEKTGRGAIPSGGRGGEIPFVERKASTGGWHGSRFSAEGVGTINPALGGGEQYPLALGQV